MWTESTFRVESANINVVWNDRVPNDAGGGVVVPPVSTQSLRAARKAKQGLWGCWEFDDLGSATSRMQAWNDKTEATAKHLSMDARREFMG